MPVIRSPGAGDIGDGKLTAGERGGGVIDASAAISLILDTGAAPSRTRACWRPTGAGGLSIRSGVNKPAAADSRRRGERLPPGRDIQGGTLNSTDGKIIYAKAGVDTLDGTTSAVNVAGRR